MKTITLALALFAGTASIAAASESDPNLLNRYPGYNMTAHGGAAAFTSRAVSLSGRHVAKSPEQRWLDRASFSTGQ